MRFSYAYNAIARRELGGKIASLLAGLVIVNSFLSSCATNHARRNDSSITASATLYGPKNLVYSIAKDMNIENQPEPQTSSFIEGKGSPIWAIVAILLVNDLAEIISKYFLNQQNGTIVDARNGDIKVIASPSFIGGSLVILTDEGQQIYNPPAENRSLLLEKIIKEIIKR